MRKEPFTIDSIVHVYNRGNRKQPIVRDDSDKWYFVQSLYYFNTAKTPENPFQSIKETLKSDFKTKLVWPKSWPERKPIVKVLGFIFSENHYHVILKEIVEGGVTLFMRRFGTGATNRFNKKYNETGRLFQGAFKVRCVKDDNYLKYLLVYVMVKNVFELYPGGFINAVKHFDSAYDWGSKYVFCSLGDYAGIRNYPLIEKDLAGEFFSTPLGFKEFAKDCISNLDFSEKLGDLTIES